MRYLVVILLACVLSTAGAQLGVGIELPEGSTLSLSAEAVTFDLRQAGYPPREFPAYYEPTHPTEPVVLRLFSNIEGAWRLEAGFAEGLLREAGGAIPPDQLEYRLDGGPWLRFGHSVVMLEGHGLSEAYDTHTIEFRIRLVGNERPGLYEGVLTFTLSTP